MLFNNTEILSKLKTFGSFVITMIIFISIYQYAQLIGFTEIKNIRIVGNNFIHKSIIEEVMEVIPSSNLMFFEVAQTQEKINEIDYIKSCRVSRIFPSTIIVEIIENEPLAYVKTLEDEFILDKDGSSLPISKKAVEHFPMPKLNYNKDVKLGNNKNNTITKDIGLELNNIKNNFPQIFHGISMIDFTQRGDVKIKFAKSTNIFVKEDKINLHFKILDEFKDLNQDLTNYSIIDLRVKDQLIVKENKIKKS